MFHKSSTAMRSAETIQMIWFGGRMSTKKKVTGHSDFGFLNGLDYSASYKLWYLSRNNYLSLKISWFINFINLSKLINEKEFRKTWVVLLRDTNVFSFSWHFILFKNMSLCRFCQILRWWRDLKKKMNLSDYIRKTLASIHTFASLVHFKGLWNTLFSSDDKI